MKVLLVESSPGVAEQVSDDLTRAGMHVVRCHESPEDHECRALDPEARCPIDEGVDVALDVRAHGDDRATAAEQPVVCAARARLPLVVAGRGANPFSRWSSAQVDPVQAVEACTAVMEGPLPRHREAVRRALDALEARGAEPVGIRSVRRDGRAVKVDLEMGERAGRERERVALAVSAALRRFDPHTPVLDISAV